MLLKFGGSIMSFTAQDVKNLRERTGCGMMECKKALSESNGEVDKAIEYLREKGLAAAAKKAGRIAAEGIVYSTVAGNKGVIVEINSETDFVAKNDQFKEFVSTVAKTIIENNPKDVGTLKTLKASDSDMTIDELLREKILTIGENIKIRRFVVEEGSVVSYIHGGGTHAVLVKFNADDSISAKDEFITLGKDIAMHITASNPQYLKESEVCSEVLEKEKEILTSQAMNEGKPAEIAEKMVIGRIKKFLKEICLLEQPFVKDQDVTVAKYVENKGKELGGNIEIAKFIRYEIGEGIEKKEDNFADEVAKMVK